VNRSNGLNQLHRDQFSQRGQDDHESRRNLTKQLSMIGMMINRFDHHQSHDSYQNDESRVIAWTIRDCWQRILPNQTKMFCCR
jgi:hypothetical protein